MEAPPLCAVCGDPLEVQDGVACRLCLTLHHRGCWDFVGRCATFACASAHFDPWRPGEPGAPRLPLVIDEGTPAPPTRPALARTAPEGVSDLWGRAVDLGAHRVPLDLTTPIEIILKGASLGFFILGIAPIMGFLRRGRPDGGMALGLLFSIGMFGLSLASLALWACTNCYYVLDNRARRLVYRRTFLGHGLESEVCPLDRIALVTVSGLHKADRRDSWFEYAVTLATPDRDLITVTDSIKSLHAANQFAAALAAHLGVPHVPGHPRQVLRVRSDPSDGRAVAIHEEPGLLDYQPVRFFLQVLSMLAVAFMVFGVWFPR